MKLRLKYLVEDVDRHGNVRCYVRIRGRRKTRIRGVPFSDEFMVQYREALASRPEAPRQARAVARGSFRYLCQRYYGSPTFQSLDRSTQAWRRRALDKICETEADKPVALMLPRHVRRLRDELKATPGAANTRLKALRALFSWATEEDEAPHDPTNAVKKIRYVENGHHSWTPSEIEQYKVRHPLGTKPRLALDLLRFTTGRR